MNKFFLQNVYEVQLFSSEMNYVRKTPAKYIQRMFKIVNGNFKFNTVERIFVVESKNSKFVVFKN